jgi:putative addiction module antidote
MIITSRALLLPAAALRELIAVGLCAQNWRKAGEQSWKSPPGSSGHRRKKVITMVITMVELKVRKFGNSLGVVLPKEVIQRLGTSEGEKVLLVEAPGGAYQLAPADAEFENKMAKARDIMSRYRNTLRILAK